MSSSKRDVLVLVQDHLTSFVDVSAFEAEPWDQAVRRWAWSYRDVFSKHTPLIPVIAVLPVTDAPKTLAMYEAVSAGFRRAGFPQERIVSAIVALESFIFGSAYDVTAPADIFDSGSMADSTPNFTAAVQQPGPGRLRQARRRRLQPGPGGDDRALRGAPRLTSRKQRGGHADVDAACPDLLSMASSRSATTVYRMIDTSVITTTSAHTSLFLARETAEMIA